MAENLHSAARMPGLGAQLRSISPYKVARPGRPCYVGFAGFNDETLLRFANQSSFGTISLSWLLTQAATTETGVLADINLTLPSHIDAWQPLP